MAKKNINKRCPFSMECGRGKCMFEQKELGCNYYYDNAMDDNVIPDQEERRRLEDERIEREKEERILAEIVEEEETAVVPARANEIALEIKIVEQNTAETVVRGGIKIGQLLKEVKASLRHGMWESWLRENVGYSITKAQRFMKLADAYEGQLAAGDDDIAELFASMLPSKALVLARLAPAQQREFVQGHDTEAMSVREMEAAVKAKEEAEKRAAEAEKEMLEERMKLDAAEQANEELYEQLQAERGKVATVSPEERAKIEAEAKRAAEDAAKAKIEAAKKKAEKELEKARTEGADAVKKVQAEQEAAIKAAKEEAKAEAERATAARVADLEEQLRVAAATASPYRVKFGACLEAMQAAYGRMLSVIEEAKQKEPSEGELLEGLAEQIVDMLKV
ncbi:MAG: DUF3102 domain-containing protein [Ruminococcaceae bacterium]|nr:DUF3102 domain-containing protein [Oscillospiraceae bacterium]